MFALAQEIPVVAPDELDDLTLARARRGEEGAFVSLVERYQGPVFALVGRMLGNGAPVEDFAQETFLRVHRALPDFSPTGPAKLSTWILTIATRLCIEELRRRERQGEPLFAEGPEQEAQESADEPTRRRRLGAELRRAVHALPLEQQAVFILRSYHELSVEEVAAALDCEPGTVKSRHSRAKATLRISLSHLGEDHVH